LEQNIVTVRKIVLEDDLKYNGKTLLTYRIEYPEFRSSFYQMSLTVINRFYRDKALMFQKYCETELFDMAVKQYEGDIENDFPVRVFEALLVYNVTYSAACIISLYFDRYEYTGGAHGNTTRDSQTWNLQKCRIIKLRKLFRCTDDYKSYILNIVEEQIKLDPDIYFDNFHELISEYFNEDSFYCTPDGIVIYYQQYDIAPYSSGIREFLIPYTDCVLNPTKMCFTI